MDKILDLSFEEIRDRVRAALNQGIDGEFWPVKTYFNHVIVEDYRNNKLYKIPYTFNDSGDVELGESAEVVRVETFDPVQKGLFVQKDDFKREVTCPVMLPGCADCDFKRGEKIFTEDEVAEFCNIYDTHFRLADQMHVFGATGQIVGESIKNWTLQEEETFTNILGETVTLPQGTWMTTIKITDDTAWQQVENGTLKGCSGTFIPRKDGEKLLESLTANKIDFSYGLDVFESVIKRVLIRDLEDPVPVTISLVDRPCVPNAIFTSIKTCPTAASKAGRSISNATLDTLNKAYEKAANALNDLMSLIDKAAGERPEANKEEIDVNKEELGKLIDEKLSPIKTELDEVKKKLPDNDPGGTAIKCRECEHELKESDKFCPECRDTISGKADATCPKCKQTINSVSVVGLT